MDAFLGIVLLILIEVAPFWLTSQHGWENARNRRKVTIGNFTLLAVVMWFGLLVTPLRGNTQFEHYLDGFVVLAVINTIGAIAFGTIHVAKAINLKYGTP